MSTEADLNKAGFDIGPSFVELFIEYGSLSVPREEATEKRNPNV